ncbi:RNA_pol_Rpb8 domain-containing protein [Cephalotus follicularis]|uniref:RNA_pol_Rpb8 domain-containing protein n=1 Tax=Cephalotus follicularis TaxID=3775 RepID=A0A1Q3BZV2_CEPFO|nr:RNA_pol_Rpb8 domain-containing protein [Cephalotus follicularis]
MGNGFLAFVIYRTKCISVVSRIEARSEKYDLFMEVDVNTEMYPIKEEEKFVVLLTYTLNADGSADGGSYSQGRKGTIEDKYEYIMCGRLYNIREDGSGNDRKTEIYVSFGGLLMLLKGHPSCLSQFQLQQQLYLCMKKLI